MTLMRLLLFLGILALFQLQSPDVVRATDYCGPGETPQFRFGFAHLKSLLGSTMGEPLECEHANPENGDSLQQTTTGLSFYRKSTNTPTFTDGWHHWAWTSDGLVYWTGAAVDPPGTIVPSNPPPTPTMLPTGNAPIASIDEPSPGLSYPKGTVILFRGSGISPIGLPISGYSWGFNGREISGESSFNWRLDEVGTMTLKVRDSRGLWSESAATVTVHVTVASPAPTATATPRPLPTSTPIPSATRPPQASDLISSAGISIGQDCVGKYSQGVTWVTAMPGNPLPDYYCYVVVLDGWPKDWAIGSTWRWPSGKTEQSSTHDLCPEGVCRGGYLRLAFQNKQGFSRQSGTLTIDLVINGSTVRSDTFRVNGSTSASGSTSSTTNRTSASVIETCIDGTFEGWDGDTVFELCNGQVWEQAEYGYTYHYAYRPNVVIYQSRYGRYKMKVDGVSDSISVTRVTNVIRTCIEGTFNGWDGDTVFPLCNGQVWVQLEYNYKYHYAYRPEVLIYQSRYGGYRMKVDRVDATIRVGRLSY
jgi:hypothetical protein